MSDKSAVADKYLTPSKASWVIPPRDLTLANSAVDVWLISLTQPHAAGGSFADFLSLDERDRAARFIFDKDRRPYVIAHAGLRSILSQYLKTAPGALRFVTGVNGKPSLAPEFAGSGLRFNLSHSHEMALLGVTQGHEIGIDIEWIKENYGFHEVAEHFFTAKEVAQLRALPVERQRQAFFKCWTSKEAFLKAKGTGLSGELDEVEIILADDQQVRIAARVPGWVLAELTPGNGYEAAVVIEGALLPVNFYRWQPV
jgi:4'-phosphopantetheinyl transferase